MKQADTLIVKQRAIIHIGGGLQPSQQRDAEVVAQVIIVTLIGQMKDAAPLLTHYLDIESGTYTALGDCKKSSGYFEKVIQLNQAHGNADGATTAMYNIAVAKSNLGGNMVKNIQEQLNASQGLYECCVANFRLIYRKPAIGRNRGNF